MSHNIQSKQTTKTPCTYVLSMIYLVDKIWLRIIFYTTARSDFDPHGLGVSSFSPFIHVYTVMGQINLSLLQ